MSAPQMKHGNETFDAGYKAGVQLWETFIDKLPRVAHGIAVRVAIAAFKDALESYLADEREEDEEKEAKG